MVKIPDWIRSRSVDVLQLESEIQALIRDELFDSVLPKSKLEVEPVNAILAEQMDWVNCISSGTQPTIDAQRGAAAVTVAEQVLSQIENHAWLNSQQGPLATPKSQESVQVPEFLKASVKAA